jgi:hypothetical protein
MAKVILTRLRTGPTCGRKIALYRDYKETPLKDTLAEPTTVV